MVKKNLKIRVGDKLEFYTASGKQVGLVIISTIEDQQDGVLIHLIVPILSDKDKTIGYIKVLVQG